MSRSGRWPGAALWGAALCAPLGLRALQLAAAGASPALPDARGVAADVGVAGLVVALWTLFAGRRGGQLVVGLLAAAWALAHYANYEHIVALGSMAGLTYAGYLADPTFFFGSALSPSAPLALGVALGASVGLGWYGAQSRGSRRHAASALLVAAVSFGVAALTPFAEERAGWRQRSLVASNALWLFSRLDTDAPILAREPGDLTGTPWLEPGAPRARNVLLILLEGISGAHVGQLREAHGYARDPSLAELDRLSRTGLSYTRFFTLQRQTNRGEYALLCGDHPKLITAPPKMSELAGTGDLPCLPAVLREAGYTTAYVQAAPLAFMLKDQFMVQAGYELVHGDEWFSRHYHRNQWGVDDRAYLEQSLSVVSELQQGEKPWFLTLLTVGTHHPFNTPPEFRGREEAGSFAWAAEYLDDALGAFLRALEAQSLLEDTLVLITSDESVGLRPSPDDVTKMLTEAWGLMVVHGPGIRPMVVDQPFSQRDVPLSVLDYLGFGDAADRFGGRSIFRRYAEPRWLVWGNTYLRQIAGLSPGGAVVVCPESFANCRAWRPAGGRTFATDRAPLALDPSHPGDLARTARSSLSARVRSGPQRFELISERRQPLVKMPGRQLLFGGQFLAAPRGSRIDVDLSMELRGESGRALVSHDLVSRNKRRHYSRRHQPLQAGETLTIRYSVTLDSAVDVLECRVWVKEPIGERLELYFHEARLEVHPPALGRTPGMKEREYQIATR